MDFLVTQYDEASQRVRFHGVPITLIQAQADALGIPLLSYPNSPETFETVFLQSLRGLRQHEVSTILFGNIHLADVRAWYEERTTAAGLIHHEPLWGDPPSQLVREFLARGYSAFSLLSSPLLRKRPLALVLVELLAILHSRCRYHRCSPKLRTCSSVIIRPSVHPAAKACSPSWARAAATERS